MTLRDEDVAALDEYVRVSGSVSRSAALGDAIRLLLHSTLQRDYAAAWAEWESTGEREVWDGDLYRPPPVDQS